MSKAKCGRSVLFVFTMSTTGQKQAVKFVIPPKEW